MVSQNVKYDKPSSHTTPPGRPGWANPPHRGRLRTSSTTSQAPTLHLRGLRGRQTHLTWRGRIAACSLRAHEEGGAETIEACLFVVGKYTLPGRPAARQASDRFSHPRWAGCTYDTVLRLPCRKWLMFCNPPLCDPVDGCAAHPGPGLVSGALCNDCRLGAEDMEVVASGKASVKSKESTASADSGPRWHSILRAGVVRFGVHTVTVPLVWPRHSAALYGFWRMTLRQGGMAFLYLTCCRNWRGHACDNCRLATD
eukprot:363880-Chlamydomonas_euryale.AAC.3